MKIYLSDNGVELLKKLEGFRAKMYLDSAGKPTIGYGTLIDTTDEQKYLAHGISKDEAELLLRQDVHEAEIEASSMIGVTLNQNQQDAIIIFIYNIGARAFKFSTIRKVINHNPKNPVIRSQFMRWIYVNSKVNEGLKNRRTQEADLYFS